MITLLRYELKKAVQNKFFLGGFLVVLATLLAIFYVFFFQSQLTYGDGATEENVSIANSYAGELTDEKVQTIVHNRLKEPIVDGRGGRFDVFSYYTTNRFLKDPGQIYEEVYSAKQNEESYPIETVPIKSVHDIGLPEPVSELKFGNFVTWTQLFQALSPAFLASSIFVILICSTLFSKDFSQNIMPLLASTKYGRGKLTLAKFGAGFIITSGVFLVVTLICFAAFGLFFGFSGWDVSIHTNFQWNMPAFPLMLNHLQIALLALGFQYIGLLAVASVTYFVSSVTDSPITSFAASLGLFVLPKLLTEVFKTGSVSQFLQLFPINNYEIKGMMQLLDSEFLLGSFVANLTFIVVLWLAVKVIADVAVYFRMKKLNVA